MHERRPDEKILNDLCADVIYVRDRANRWIIGEQTEISPRSRSVGCPQRVPSGSSLIMMVQAGEAASGQEGERRPFGAPFDPDLKIVNDLGADGICDRHSRIRRAALP